MSIIPLRVSGCQLSDSAVVESPVVVVDYHLVADTHVRDVLTLRHDVIVRELSVVTARYALREDVEPIVVLLVVHALAVHLAVASILCTAHCVSFHADT